MKLHIINKKKIFDKLMFCVVKYHSEKKMLANYMNTNFAQKCKYLICGDSNATEGIDRLMCTLSLKLMN